MEIGVPRSILGHDVLAIEIRNLFLKLTIVFKFQWEVNHGPETNVQSLFSCKPLLAFS